MGVGGIGTEEARRQGGKEAKGERGREEENEEKKRQSGKDGPSEHARENACMGSVLEAEREGG